MIVFMLHPRILLGMELILASGVGVGEAGPGLPWVEFSRAQLLAPRCCFRYFMLLDLLIITPSKGLCAPERRTSCCLGSWVSGRSTPQWCVSLQSFCKPGVQGAMEEAQSMDSDFSRRPTMEGGISGFSFLKHFHSGFLSGCTVLYQNKTNKTKEL